MESDSDLQEYYSQLARKTYELQHERSSDGELEPSLSDKHVLVESNQKMLPTRARSRTDEIKDEKLDKIKSMEEKYLRKTKVSISLSDLNPEEDTLKDTQSPEERGIPFHYDKPSYDSEGSYLSCSKDEKAPREVTAMTEIFGTSLDQKKIKQSTKKISTSIKSSQEQPEKSLSCSNILNEEKASEGENVFYASKPSGIRRKSSICSLLMNKDSVFYSSSMSTDKSVYRRSSSVIKFSKYDSKDFAVAESGSVPTESVEEDITQKSTNCKPLLGKAVDNSKSCKQVKETSRNFEIVKDDPNHKTFPNSCKMSALPNKSKLKMGNSSAVKSSKNESESESPPKRKKHRRKRNVRHVRHSRLKESLSESSTTYSSLYCSSGSSSFIKRKRRRYGDTRLIEAILKVLLRNLPFVLRESICRHGDSDPKFHLRNCSSTYSAEIDVESWRTTNARIEDALRQTIALTRQFLDLHKELTWSHQSQPSYQYTQLKNVNLS